MKTKKEVETMTRDELESEVRASRAAVRYAIHAMTKVGIEANEDGSPGERALFELQKVEGKA